MEFELDNSRVQIQEPGLLEEDYTFTSGTHEDFTGTALDFGWLRPQDEADQPAPHLMNSVIRTWRWVRNNERYDPGSVDVLWPDGDTGAYYDRFWEEIHISPERQWMESTHSHEFGHHVMENFAVNPSPDYCNGVCDGGDCGHCVWCEETDHDAFNEGWPNWLADVVTRALPGLYGYPTLYTRSQESLAACLDVSGNPCACDPLRTEGFVGALLRDIEDGGFGDAHPAFPGFRDRLAMGTHPIFTVALEDEPTTVAGFLNAFRARFPAVIEDLWETARNCGYEIDAESPGLVTAFTSPSHSTTGDSPDATVDLTWTHAPDDAAGIAGYAITATASPSVPPAAMIVGKVEEATIGPLGVGTWWFNIRAVDRAGRWSTVYVSFGPVAIRPPTPANLVVSATTGWASPVVPRASTGATATSVPAPTTLTGNAQATFWNVRVLNSGEQSTGVTTTARVRLDGGYYYELLNPTRGVATVGVLAAGASSAVLNQNPVWISGGRHVFGAEVDAAGGVHESSESDNRYATQWIWAPFVLADQGGTYRINVPVRDGGWAEASGALYYNCDGVRFSSTGWWNAVWVYASNNEHDFDLRLHQASTGASNGFASNVGWSTRTAGCLDAVLVNRNQTALVEPWDVGVIRSGLDAGSSLRTYNLSHVISQQVAFNASSTVSLGASQMLALREFYVPAAGNVTIDIAQADPAQGPVHLIWLDSGFVTGDLLDASGWDTTGDDGRARLDRSIAGPGYHCAVILRDPKDTDGAQPLMATLRIGTTLCELLALTPVGWHGPLVPRPANDGTPTLVPMPTLLNGGGPTYFNFAVSNASPSPTGGAVGVGVLCDGSTLLPVLIPGGMAAFASGRWNWPIATNVAPGRHSVALWVDNAEAYAELNEANNVYGEQWSWRPTTPLAPGPSAVQPQPPDPLAGFDRITTGEFVFNSSGHRTPVFTQTGDDGWWGAVAAAPMDSNDVDLRLHAATDNPKTGFSVPLASSGWGPGSGEFLLIDFNNAAATQFDVGVLSNSGASGYRLDVRSSTHLGFEPAGVYGPFALNPGQLVNIHEVLLDPGTHSVRVENLDGVVDYGVSVYGPSGAYYGKSDAMAASWFAPGGADEYLGFDVTTPGYYAVCVWKSDSVHTTAAGSYRLEFGAATAAPGVVTLTTGIRGVSPNPFNPRTTVSFALQGSGATDLVVYNLRGERIRVLASGSLEAGRHDVVWDGRDDRGRAVASGSYVVELRHAAVRRTYKLTLVK